MTKMNHEMVALRERAESAEAELLAVREDNHSMMLEIHNLRIDRDALAAELAKLREQEPVAVVAESGRLLFAAGGSPDQYMKNKIYRGPLYAASVPAPAVPAAPDDIHELAYELGGTDFGEYHLEPEALDRIIAAVKAAPAVSGIVPECWRDMPEIRKFARALLQSAEVQK